MITFVPFRATRVLLAFGSLLAVSLPTSAFAQTAPVCGSDIKEEVAKALSAVANADEASQLRLEKELYDKYSYCLPVGQTVPSALAAAARQCGATISQLGSFFEEMSYTGYDPQRRQFAAPIKIKQVLGIGGGPLPGSREHVLHCVAEPAGVFRPVGHDSVHLANALAGQAPTWQFAVIAAANNNLWLVQPMNGQTRRARSILS